MYLHFSKTLLERQREAAIRVAQFIVFAGVSKTFLGNIESFKNTESLESLEKSLENLKELQDFSTGDILCRLERVCLAYNAHQLTHNRLFQLLLALLKICGATNGCFINYQNTGAYSADENMDLLLDEVKIRSKLRIGDNAIDQVLHSLRSSNVYNGVEISATIARTFVRDALCLAGLYTPPEVS